MKTQITPKVWNHLLNIRQGNACKSLNGWSLEEQSALDLYGPLARRDQGPVVVAQIGQSLDGRIATVTGDAQDVSGPDGLAHLHRMRALVDGVIIGKTFDAKHLPFILGDTAVASAGLGDSIGNGRSGDALEALSIYLDQRLDRYMEIQSIIVGSPEYLDIRLQNGTRIKLPRDQIKSGLEHAVAGLVKAREVGRVIQLIDFVPSIDNPIVTYL